MKTIPTGQGSRGRQRSVVIGDAAATGLDPTLDAAPLELAREFPNELEGTRLSLYDAGHGEMRAHWRLERNDLERAGASFRSGDGGTRLVVRLRRLRDGARGELAGEARVDRAAATDSGEAGFRLDPDNALYLAELGLVNGAGGWLMLARSNRLYNPVPVRLSFPERTPDVELGADTAGPPISRPAWQMGATTANSLPPDSLNARALEGAPLATSPVRMPEPFERAPSVGEEDVASRIPGNAPHAEDARRAGDMGSVPATPLSADPNTVRWGPISPPTYENGTLRAAGLELDAELRVHGRAPPNTDIDLFGHPFRVGPGGRFLLVLPIADPELLRKALDLNPPPELRVRRDD